jgi:hypothetical protein
VPDAEMAGVGSLDAAPCVLYGAGSPGLGLLGLAAGGLLSAVAVGQGGTRVLLLGESVRRAGHCTLYGGRTRYS